MAGSVLLRSFRNQYLPAAFLNHASRCMTTKPPQKPQPKLLNHMPLKRSWLTRKVEESLMWRTLFFKITDLIGYGSPKQMAGRRSFILYDKVCAVKPDDDRAFWQDGESNTCYSPFGATGLRTFETRYCDFRVQT